MNIRDALPDSRENESIFVFERPYFMAFLPWLATGIGLIIMGVVVIISISFAVPDTLSDPLTHNVFVIISGAYFLMIVPFLTAGFINYYLDLYIVTDQRLIDVNQSNLFARQINELSLDQVEDVSSSTKGYLSSIFDFGNVSIETAGAEEKFAMHLVLHPREIAAIILDLSEQAKERLENHLEPELTLVPRGTAKGVVQGKVLTSIAPLAAMGALADSAAATTQSQSTAPIAAKNYSSGNNASTASPSAGSGQTPSSGGTTPPQNTTSTVPQTSDGLDIVIDDPHNTPPKQNPPA